MRNLLRVRLRSVPGGGLAGRASYSAKPKQQSVRNGLWIAGVVIATVHAWYIANDDAS